jgi:hypothetical protein
MFEAELVLVFYRSLAMAGDSLATLTEIHSRHLIVASTSAKI